MLPVFEKIMDEFLRCHFLSQKKATVGKTKRVWSVVMNEAKGFEMVLKNSKPPKRPKLSKNGLFEKIGKTISNDSVRIEAMGTIRIKMQGLRP